MCGRKFVVCETRSQLLIVGSSIFEAGERRVLLGSQGGSRWRGLELEEGRLGSQMTGDNFCIIESVPFTVEASGLSVRVCKRQCDETAAHETLIAGD